MTRVVQIGLAAMLLLSPVVLAGNAQAKGCLKGAAVGGLAGHMAGHGVLGAMGGCAVGHHMANRNDTTNNRSYNNDPRYSNQNSGYGNNSNYSNNPDYRR
jgi:hypothetical protein